MAAFGGGFLSGTQSQTPTPGQNPNKDVEVVSPPADGISSVNFSPVANLLIATSWDNQVRCWEVQSNGTSAPKTATQHDQPVLCSAWSPDGSTVFAGGCDNMVKMWNLQTNQSQQVAKHDAPVRQVKFVKDMNNLLVTGSWDKTVRYWDLRQANPVHVQQLPERVYAMDAVYPLLVVALAGSDRKIQIYNLGSPGSPAKDIESPLKWQTRCVTCFPDHTGFLIGSVEGRVAVQHVDDAAQTRNFTFKCHRDNTDVFAVNSISFHPQFGTFVTAGADGAYNFWDKDSKQRLKAMQKCGQAITSGSFSPDGTIYAYSVSYDWSRGYSEYNLAAAKNYIYLHANNELEVKSRKNTSRR